MNDAPSRIFAKIAVAFDPACSAAGLLEAAADLAVAIDAELEALFVEDPDIQRLSQLPFGRMIHPSSGKAETFDPSSLAARRAGPAARSRAVLRELSRRHPFRYSVREAAGRAFAEAAAELTAELLVLAAFHAKFGFRPELDRDVLSFAAACGRSVLLVSSLPVSTARILLVADDSDAGRRASALATRMSARNVPGGEPMLARMTPDDADSDAIIERIRRERPGLLVIGVADAALAERIRGRLDHETVSVLTVR